MSLKYRLDLLQLYHLPCIIHICARKHMKYIEDSLDAETAETRCNVRNGDRNHSKTTTKKSFLVVLEMVRRPLYARHASDGLLDECWDFFLSIKKIKKRPCCECFAVAMFTRDHHPLQTFFVPLNKCNLQF